MNNGFSTEAIIKSLKTNKSIQYGNIELGYVPGLPILTIQNGNLCMKVPYIKYKITGETDKTLVYPVRYVYTVSLPEGNIVGFEDLMFNKTFARVDFGTPVGLFRHDAIKSLNKKAYAKLRSVLYSEYDRIIRHLANGDAYTVDDEKHFKALFNIILEPSLIPFYSALDPDFANRYIVINK